MALRITQLAESLQTILTDKAEEVAFESGFVQRKRKLTGAVFVQTLVLGWMETPDASLEDLVTPEWAEKRICSAQALDQRFTEKGAECLRLLLSAAMGVVVAANPENIPLLRRFNGVYLEDCTTVSLPASLAAEFPGCGGHEDQGLAAIKTHLRWELTTGALVSLTFQPGRQPDVTAGQAAGTLPAGSLRLADMGFFDLNLLVSFQEQKVHWITRLPVGVKLVADKDEAKSLVEFLADQKGDVLDMPIRVGREEKLACRLVAFRCPPAIVQKRRERVEKQARKKGRKVSAQRLALCEWTVFITDLPPDQLQPKELWVLYRSRWQIELLFKTWKSYGGVDQSKGNKPYRVLCELFAKLIGIVIRHWLILLRGGPLAGFSVVKAIRKVRKVVSRLARALRNSQPLEEVLPQVQELLSRIKRQARRRRSPSTRQLLFQPQLMN